MSLKVFFKNEIINRLGKLIPLVLIVVGTFWLSVIHAYDSPSGEAPESNTEKPINESSDVQIKDGAIGIDRLLVSGATALLGILDMSGYEIVNIASPTTANSIATKEYVDTQLGSGGSSTLLEGLISWFDFDETSGNRNDEQGGYDLNDVNTVGSISGKLNNAALFVEANNESLTSSSSIFHPGSGSFTMAFWVKVPESRGSGNQMHVVAMGNAGVNDSYRLLLTRPSGGVSPSLRVRFANETNVTLDGSTMSYGSGWHHFVFYVDRDAHEIGLSQDGGNFVTATAPDSDVHAKNWDFTVGALSSGGGKLEGAVDTLGYWNRVLTADEKDALYNEGQGVAFSSLGSAGGSGGGSGSGNGQGSGSVIGTGNGVLRLPGGGGATQPVDCPAGWTEADPSYPLGATWEGAGTVYYFIVRNCIAPEDQYCRSMNLRAYEEPGECPAGWTEVDYKFEPAPSYKGTGGGYNNVRTCLMCQ